MSSPRPLLSRYLLAGGFALLLGLMPACQSVDPSNFPCDGDAGECPADYSCDLSTHYCAAILIDGGDIATATDGGDGGSPVEGPVDAGPDAG